MKLAASLCPPAAAGAAPGEGQADAGLNATAVGISGCNVTAPPDPQELAEAAEAEGEEPLEGELAGWVAGWEWVGVGGWPTS